MKFSDLLRMPNPRRIALLLGILCGVGVGIFVDWRYGLLAGAALTLVVSLLLPTIFYLNFLPYKRLKQTLKGPFWFDEPVQFTVKTGRVNGFFLLTDKSMVFLSHECATPTLELTRDKVQKTVVHSERMTLDIYLNDKQIIRVFSDVCDELVEILREHGWSIAE